MHKHEFILMINFNVISFMITNCIQHYEVQIMVSFTRFIRYVYDIMQAS